jgi:hypothetical protein
VFADEVVLVGAMVDGLVLADEAMACHEVADFDVDAGPAAVTLPQYS